MKFTINTKSRGPVTFSRPFKHYVYVDLNGLPGASGHQICEGGTLRGNTIMFSGDDQEAFNTLCRKWWRRARS